jgi:hypothetical protein
MNGGGWLVGFPSRQSLVDGWMDGWIGTLTGLGAGLDWDTNGDRGWEELAGIRKDIGCCLLLSIFSCFLLAFYLLPGGRGYEVGRERWGDDGWMDDEHKQRHVLCSSTF